MKPLRLLLLFGIAAAVVLPIRLWVIEPIYIASPSMEPTLAVGDHLFMDRVSLLFRLPKRGEIIVFRSPVGEDIDLVKRVIAVPGDTVRIKAKKVFVNDKELDETYVQHTRAGESLEGDDVGPLPIPKGFVFVLGDNRDESKDSSVWKDPETGRPVFFLPLDNVRGLVRGVY